MESNCTILKDYINYLTVIKARSKHTTNEYNIDIQMFFRHLYQSRHELTEKPKDCSFADIDFIKSITLGEMYAFISYCQSERKCTIQTCSRKIIAIRQFWKYLKTKAKLIDNNIADELESPKLPKRIPKYLDLEDSIRLLMQLEKSPRDYCIVSLFLNCALRLSELTSLNVSQIDAETVTVIGKGNKERHIYLTSSAKRSVSRWLAERKKYHPVDNALFVTYQGNRMSGRSVQVMVKKALKEAGLNDKDITPHKLRHSAATLLYRYGKVDIRALKEILGHNNISTTEIYTHIDNQQLQTAINSNPLAGMFGHI